MAYIDVVGQRLSMVDYCYEQLAIHVWVHVYYVHWNAKLINVVWHWACWYFFLADGWNEHGWNGKPTSGPKQGLFAGGNGSKSQFRTAPAMFCLCTTLPKNLRWFFKICIVGGRTTEHNIKIMLFGTLGWPVPTRQRSAWTVKFVSMGPYTVFPAAL